MNTCEGLISSIGLKVVFGGDGDAGGLQDSLPRVKPGNMYPVYQFHNS